MKKRILHILPQFQPGGGIDSVVMNYVRNMDGDKFKNDILTHRVLNDEYVKEVKGRCNVYVFPEFSPKNLTYITDCYKEIIKKNQYDVVHCHMANAAFLYLKIAFEEKIPLRILHSHQDHYSDKIMHAIRNVPLIYLGKKYANYKIACSKQAGDFLFKQKYTIINNGIDINKFRFDENKRLAFREQNGIKDCDLVLAFVARFVPQKNPLYVLEIFSNLVKGVPDAKLLLAGDGSLKQRMFRFAMAKNIENNIIWLGNVSDTSVIYSAADILLMPSKYEGLGLSLIEGQCSGIICLCSNKVPNEAKVSTTISFLPIGLEDINLWVNSINNTLFTTDRKNAYKSVIRSGYDIKDAVKNLEQIYVENTNA